ncbi:hypothetical protein P6U16_05855 [Rhizobium sp. 32-5/1]|uniref:hypothetical protein n=1 Tax=Rhizobium sp. 32-5/1 TaxID=3019602 RepID=UPI00240D5882|nr:hypothetical protein [Rhizobium sp. 32-5/1]WEZ85270.1 hypothetical protein P6U16_05855 [Rhizobium sp. 32-5/1]
MAVQQPARACGIEPTEHGNWFIGAVDPGQALEMKGIIAGIVFFQLDFPHLAHSRKNATTAQKQANFKRGKTRHN